MIRKTLLSKSEVLKEWKPPKERGFIRGLKKVGKFIIEHPVESLEIAGVAASGAYKIISSIRGNSNAKSSASNSVHKTNSDINTSDSTMADISSAIADIVEKANRATPHENDVPAHKKRYHTKDGVVWRDKAPYHRGGKGDD